MTREEILKDQWVIDHYGDFYHPNYLNPDFEAGVDYGEEKVIEKACEWIESAFVEICDMSKIPYNVSIYTRYRRKTDLINDFKKAMELNL